MWPSGRPPTWPNFTPFVPNSNPGPTSSLLACAEDGRMATVFGRAVALEDWRRARWRTEVVGDRQPGPRPPVWPRGRSEGHSSCSMHTDHDALRPPTPWMYKRAAIALLGVPLLSPAGTTYRLGSAVASSGHVSGVMNP
ncbi:predicted protein [Chaetomium globosum CBS 148.51]|uniref:Uncharacterized protein n=1 Tax=Chaetomium globosum (strain ATCC 6205 / CBS 148.51 / DSM 1962 / NBRC 6347 / NRRL 1970) TaxID=306901 RepID=Q2GQM5_CHAGB|nr:uncharacterized protein CHGG_09729 [Chaetomium globosum CBS 148.51]EAQ83325.1 predicted protein [Chaetomium globosum CBS 148.51]